MEISLSLNTRRRMCPFCIWHPYRAPNKPIFVRCLENFVETGLGLILNNVSVILADLYFFTKNANRVQNHVSHLGMCDISFLVCWAEA